MHRFIRRAALFAAAIAVSVTAASAAVLGTQSASHTTTVSTGGTTLDSASFTGSGTKSERYFTYSPGSDVRPIVAYGDTLYGRSTLSYVANWVRGQNLAALGGINASFFDLNSGLPTGAEVTGGILRTSNVGFSQNSIGFYADGTAVIGNPSVSTTLLWPDRSTSLCHYNRVLTKDCGYVLYSRDFDKKTRSSIPAVHIVLEPEQAELTLGGTVCAKVVQLLDRTDCEIPAGCFVLSLAKDTPYHGALAKMLALKAGDSLEFRTTCAEGWASCTYLCSAGDLLVRDGAAATKFQLDPTGAARAARTALGVKADGSVVLYTVDGGAYASYGITLPQLAARMQELGCVQAVNLDGGGSTTLGTISASGSVSIVNRPSDGQQRKCANFLYLIYDIQSLRLQASQPLLLPGARSALTVQGVSGIDTVTPAPPKVTLSASSGSISGLTFTAPADAGSVTLRAVSGSASGSCTVTVAEPDTITLANADTGKPVSSLTLDTGASVDLDAAASRDGSAVYGTDACYTWTLSDPALGEVTKDGVFTAAETETDLSGTLTVSCGEAQTELPILVEGGVQFVRTVADFESSFPASESGMTVAPEQSTVRFGRRAAALRYDLAGAVNQAGSRQVTCRTELPLEEQARVLGLWVYGDQSANALSVRISQDGETRSLWAATLNFSGWKYVSVRLPRGEKTLTGFAVTEGQSSAAASGSILLDQCTVSRFPIADAAPPTLTLTPSGGELLIRATDGGSGVAAISATMDGREVRLPAGSAPALTLPEDGAMHQIQVFAVDASGNRTSKSYTCPGAVDAPFADLGSHWAAEPVCYLASQGVLDGSTAADGTRRYRPAASMTRQEFIKAVVSWLSPDPAAFAAVELPFADTASIAPWALNSCKAAYSMGLVGGAASSDGTLRLNPLATITRQEAMLILSRTQEAGYAANDLAGFSDAASVASWARDAIGVMVGRGVISGSGGRLNPTGAVTRAEVAKMIFMLY